MLTDTLYRHPRTSGVQTLQQRGQGGARELTTHRLRLEAGSSVHQPPDIRHRELGHSADLELLEIVMPGDFETANVDRV